MNLSKPVLTLLISILFFSAANGQSDQAMTIENAEILFHAELVKIDSTSNLVDLPVDIMDQLIVHDELFASDINYMQDRSMYIVTASFAFEGMDRFRTWYQSNETRSLFKTFKTDFDQLEIEFKLRNN